MNLACALKYNPSHGDDGRFAEAAYSGTEAENMVGMAMGDLPGAPPPAKGYAGLLRRPPTRPAKKEAMITIKKGVFDYAKVLDPRPYFDAKVNFAPDTMQGSYSEVAASVLANVPTDEVERLRTQFERYQSFADVPDHLMAVLQTYA